MVVSINGADDYAEVSTTTGKHLVRMTLAGFAKSLDPSKYVRVHRSWIVNTCRVTRAEPAGGGRLLLHMETGQTISTSDGADSSATAFSDPDLPQFAVPKCSFAEFFIPPLATATGSPG